jgi:hypothetical protein
MSQRQIKWLLLGYRHARCRARFQPAASFFIRLFVCKTEEGRLEIGRRMKSCPTLLNPVPIA